MFRDGRSSSETILSFPQPSANMRRRARATPSSFHLLLVAALFCQTLAAPAPRVVNEALAFGVVVSGTVAPPKYAAASAPPASKSPPAQSGATIPAAPPGPVPAAAFCYNVTVDPAILSTVVFWKGKSLYARMQTCSGMPLLRASVYGCPSIDPNARVVWQYMSPAMMSSQSQRAAPLPADWEWASDSQAMAFELTHQTFYIEVVPHPNATVDSSFQLSTYLFDSTEFPKEKIYPLTNTLGWNKTLEQKSLTSSSSSFGADPNAGNIQVWKNCIFLLCMNCIFLFAPNVHSRSNAQSQLLFYLPGDNRRVNSTNATNSSAPLPASAPPPAAFSSASTLGKTPHAASRQLFSVKDGVAAPTPALAQAWADLHNDAEQRLAALAAEGFEPHQSDSEFPFRCVHLRFPYRKRLCRRFNSHARSAHAKKHARVRDAAAASAFATPGVYWNSPQPARWAVPASDAKYEFLVYVREITDYVDKTFKALRDEVNDLPATLSSVTKNLGKSAVRTPPSPLPPFLLPPPPSPHACPPCEIDALLQNPDSTPCRCPLLSRTATRSPCGLPVAWPCPRTLAPCPSTETSAGRTVGGCICARSGC